MTTSPICPKCGGAMRRRQGKRGAFLGCANYPGCRGTRDLPEAAASIPEPAEVTPGAVGDLLTDLRRANGYVGKAVDILRRRADEIAQVMHHATDDETPF